MDKRKVTSEWFENLRNQLCEAFELIEIEYAEEKGLTPGRFKRKSWDRDGGGGGTMSIMKGNVFEEPGYFQIRRS